MRRACLFKILFVIGVISLPLHHMTSLEQRLTELSTEDTKSKEQISVPERRVQYVVERPTETPLPGHDVRSDMMQWTPEFVKSQYPLHVWDGLQAQIENGLQVVLATPCYGGSMEVGYTRSLLELNRLFFLANISFSVAFMGNESLISRARNHLASMFLDKKENTHLLFLDADVMFNPWDILLMIALDVDVVAGNYPQKSMNLPGVVEVARKYPKLPLDLIEPISLYYNGNHLTSEELQKCNTPLLLSRFVQVKEAPTGTMLIQRRVFELLQSKHPSRAVKGDVRMDRVGVYASDNLFAFFQEEICPTTKRFLSEDYAFCKLVRDTGMTVYLDLCSKSQHCGKTNFCGNSLYHNAFHFPLFVGSDSETSMPLYRIREHELT